MGLANTDRCILNKDTGEVLHVSHSKADSYSRAGKGLVRDMKWWLICSAWFMKLKAGLRSKLDYT